MTISNSNITQTRRLSVSSYQFREKMIQIKMMEMSMLKLQEVLIFKVIIVDTRINHWWHLGMSVKQGILLELLVQYVTAQESETDSTELVLEECFLIDQTKTFNFEIKTWFQLFEKNQKSKMITKMVFPKANQIFLLFKIIK